MREMTDLYQHLAWLPIAPEDFRAQCRQVAQSPDSEGRDVARLASYALDENQMCRLASAIKRMRESGRALEPLAPFKLAIVGNATLDPLVDAFIASAARHGVALECVHGDFGQMLQEALCAESVINRAKPDAILIALDYRVLMPPSEFGNERESSAAIEDALQLVRSLRHGFSTNAHAPSIVQTLAPPPETLFGSREPLVAGTWRSLVAQFNQQLLADVCDGQDLILDVAAIAETVGLANWHSPTQWNIAKFAFDAKFLPLYADHVARLLGALRGKSRKCLVLDLDNTLWSGVIGDDGLQGIVLGQGDATGEAHLEVQRSSLNLRKRGIVLAVSSKNDDQIARSVFREHSEMLLREDHFAVFQANWNDKATNIAAIARELSLGIDSIVFLDDNPVERALVREALPEVAVPELPDDPALYSRTLAAAGYFEAVAFSSEDRKRADFYHDNARRAALQQQVGDIEGYLASLKMQITFQPFDKQGRSRITQLVNKTNQFNLTTRRYTEAEIAAFDVDPAVFTLQVRLTDRFGDNGMISVVICRMADPQTWEIDTWLMSCRVLGRRVESAVLREIIVQARAAGIKRLVGSYVPTERNALVADHYHKLGFRLLSEDSAGSTTWELATETEVEAPPIEVVRTELLVK